MDRISQKRQSSPQFTMVANVLDRIQTDVCGDLRSEYSYLAVCPWTGEALPATVQNIDTTLFCQLFHGVKPTSVARHLRFYKENFNEYSYLLG